MCGDRVGKQTLEANAEQISVCVCPWPCHIACFAESDRHATNMIKKILLFSKVRYACGSWNSVSTEIARARAPAARRREARSRRKAREISEEGEQTAQLTSRARPNIRDRVTSRGHHLL